MKNVKGKGIGIIVISAIVMIISIVLIIANIKNKDQGSSNTTQSIYEVDNSFKVSSPLAFQGPYEVNVYGIVKNNSAEDIKDVKVRVYYYDTDRKRHEVNIPSFDINAYSEYTIDYDTTGAERAFYVDKVEYKIGNGSFKKLNDSFFAGIGTSNDSVDVGKIIPFIILLVFSIFGVFAGVAFTTYNMPTAEHVIDIFKPSVRKNIVQCQYCGSNNKHGTFKCSSCGANIEYDERES